MANGCTDRTEEIVLDYARSAARRCISFRIPLGDKCNAWNVFIHETVPAHCPGREVYFFMDGDATVVPGSFSAMMRALKTQSARARGLGGAGGGPQHGTGLAGTIWKITGWSRTSIRCAAAIVERLRQLSVRIPVGLEGDDGLIGALTKWDLAPDRNGFDEERIVPCADAGFAFEPMSPFRPADWRVYWKRAVRYGRRRYEFELLGSRLKEKGLAGLPAHIADSYTAADSLRLRWQGFYTLTNFVALRDMRRIGNARRAAEAGSGRPRVS